MSITKRLSADSKILYRFDKGLVQHVDRFKKYIETLDIDAIGDLAEYTDRPSVFVVRPLTTQYEHLENGEESNWWGIFQTHVKEITDFDVPLVRTNDIIEDSVREQLPPRVIRDIAEQIIILANDERDSVFFTEPGGWRDWVLGARAHHVHQISTAAVRSVDAQIKNQKQASDH